MLYHRDILDRTDLPDELFPCHVSDRPKTKYDFLRRWINGGLFRIKKATDPEHGNFTKYGTYGFAPYHKKAEGVEQPMTEYELQRYMHDSWREVPQKKFYERLMHECHTASHIGSNLTLENLGVRFTWPHLE